jgi:uncharacterized membrane protein YhaH (DUF805 family)
LLGLGALALNGWLMLVYLGYYKGVLQRHALAVGEDSTSNYDTLYVNAAGRTGRSEFVGALVVLLAVYAFYHFLVPGRNSQWVQLTLVFPAIVLLARRVRDMGVTGWLVIVPAALVLATAYLYLYLPEADYKGTVALAAIVVSAAFMVWGLLGKTRAEGNRLGAAAA